jgi:glycosyltransferase involved in cell wall biosynthesis
MKSAEISIVIPNYNNKHYLADCLDSVLRQSFKDIEILIADDCSTDGSIELINRYACQYPDIIRIVFNRKNLGVARNRHMGILELRGKYVTTLDSDDMYADEKKLEREYSLIKQYEKKEGRDVVAFSNVRLLFNDSSEEVVGTDENIREGDIFQPLLLRNCFIPRDFLFKREMYFLVGGYNPSYKIYEDWNFKLKLAKHYPFYYTGITGVIYRRHGQGLSSHAVEEHLEYLRKSFSEEISSINDWKTIKKYKSDFEKNLINVFRTGYRRESNLKRAFFMLKCAMNSLPK